jgi:hypothetical protein
MHDEGHSNLLGSRNKLGETVGKNNIDLFVRSCWSKYPKEIYFQT